MKVDLSRVGTWYHGYINLVSEEKLSEAFTSQSAAFVRFLENIPMDKYDYRYADDKWTIKEVVQHVIDAERIFAYRALRFSRMDDTQLHSFDENLYARTAGADKRSWDRLVEEFQVVRRSSELLFQSFSPEQLNASGMSANSPTYVEAIGYTLLGHGLHHVKVTKERYLTA